MSNTDRGGVRDSSTAGESKKTTWIKNRRGNNQITSPDKKIEKALVDVKGENSSGQKIR